AVRGGLVEVDERGAKVFAVWGDEGGDGCRGRDGTSVGEDDVAVYPEGWIGVGDGDGVVEGGAGGHEGGGGEGVGVVKLCDGAIDTASKAEVVRVDDESGRHRTSLETRFAAVLQEFDMQLPCFDRFA